ncbi:MAG: recombinase family protein [Kiloniellales bacterium]
MTKITPEHLARAAVVYVRQSTAFQVAQNLESQRRQYGLAERARQLGWSDVEVIDDDLGRSGAGARRPGFEKLLAAICEGRVGAVLSLEASRLARNGRDWHTLLEFCGLVGTLIIDEDGVYDSASPNDRLLLGMKGTMSEMELSVFRQRSIEAMKQKARRGELFLTVAVGYVKVGGDRIEKDADRRVREAMALVFRKFTELQTIRQVLVWCRQEKILLPALGNGAAADRITWRLPVYSTVHHMLTNPVYAGAYAFGRRTTRVTIENGRKRVVRSMQRDWRSWDVLIRDHHEGYITWAEFERNQQLIADNTNGKRFMSRGAVRSGEALLPGLLRCARCGKKLRVRYGQTFRYECVGAFNQMAAARCITFGGMRVDRVLAKEVLDKLQPLGVEAALAAIEARSQQRSEKKGQRELALQQARYEAARAQRQYDAADPENRLVTGELEQRWNERLVAVRDLELEIDRLNADKAPALTEADRERLMALGQDLVQAWESPGATPETRKKIVRTVISEIIVDVVGDKLDLVVHWEGGDHTRLTVKRNRAGQTRWTTDTGVVDLVRALARQMPDEAIAAVLNRSGKTTGHGNSWTRGRICSLRRQYDIAIYREGERAERGEATLDEAAAFLALSKSTIRRLIAEGALPAYQHCKGAPWIIRQADLERDEIRRQADLRRSRRPPPDQRQRNLLDLSTT